MKGAYCGRYHVRCMPFRLTGNTDPRWSRKVHCLSIPGVEGKTSLLWFCTTRSGIYDVCSCPRRRAYHFRQNVCLATCCWHVASMTLTLKVSRICGIMVFGLCSTAFGNCFAYYWCLGGRCRLTNAETSSSIIGILSGALLCKSPSPKPSRCYTSHCQHPPTTL